MDDVKTWVPTYYGGQSRRGKAAQEMPEFGEPSVPVLLLPADGVRIVLGSHDAVDRRAADVQIERRPNGWAIFLQPLNGCDSSGIVCVLDDGRSFVVPAGWAGCPAIELVKSLDAVPELDEPRQCTPAE